MNKIAQRKYGRAYTERGTSITSLQADNQSQSIHVDKVLLPQREITVPLMLRNSTPEQTGYLRIHDLVVLVASHP
ncbi:DUF3251 domain-containing protein [Erwinia mallotivora]|uniref:DUF3251 domain-containing protein n=1 Tax=Erwinia mallotivora TaxID=69222 RepID=UPI0035ED127F